MDLLIADKSNDLTIFSDLPNLSYDIIHDFATLLRVVLALQAEMYRRINDKKLKFFAGYSHIVFVIDEFNGFVGEATDETEKHFFENAVSQILRMGRHAKITMIIAAHNPTRKNMLIDTSDMLVKVTFSVANVQNSVTAIGKGGAEKLKGNGDMLFKASGEIKHLQAPYISDKMIERTIKRRMQEIRPKYVEDCEGCSGLAFSEK